MVGQGIFSGYDTLDALVIAKAKESGADSLAFQSDLVAPGIDPVGDEEILVGMEPIKNLVQIVESAPAADKSLVTLARLDPDQERNERRQRLLKRERADAQQGVVSSNPLFMIYKGKFPVILDENYKGGSLIERLAMEDLFVFYPKVAYSAASEQGFSPSRVRLAYGQENRSALLVVRSQELPGGEKKATLLEDPLLMDDGIYVLWARWETETKRLEESKKGEGGAGKVSLYANIFDMERKRGGFELYSQPRRIVVKTLHEEHEEDGDDDAFVGSFLVEDRMGRMLDPSLTNLTGSRYVRSRAHRMVSEPLDYSFYDLVKKISDESRGGLEETLFSVIDQVVRLQTSLSIAEISHGDIKEANVMGKDGRSPTFVGFARPETVPEAVWNYVRGPPIYENGTLSAIDFGCAWKDDERTERINPRVSFSPGYLDRNYFENGLYPSHSTDTYAFGITLRNIVKGELVKKLDKLEEANAVDEKQKRVSDRLHALDRQNYDVFAKGIVNQFSMIYTSRPDQVGHHMQNKMSELERHDYEWHEMLISATECGLLDLSKDVLDILHKFTILPSGRFMANQKNTAYVMDRLTKAREGYRQK